ncbi:hypothetical protein LT679_00290 [Mucilaginibacter roseus]|uniref:Uncharacterized protein n=1 Tax=Mucilaginibacter roseus TaxID=1528868 RepID=A0ABS8TYY2_9SPHI|nr:hypothetical protein [Mucilaginibacter roseus]MCD8739023.1 hypothetical protein [Mucilaginibacter roseus]
MAKRKSVDFTKQLFRHHSATNNNNVLTPEQSLQNSQFSGVADHLQG